MLRIDHHQPVTKSWSRSRQLFVRLLAVLGIAGCTEAAETVAAKPADGAAQTAPADQPKLYVREFRVLGAKTLPRIEVEEAVYPYLGPGRTFDDIEKARVALEKAYQDKGYKATQVIIPSEQPGAAAGIVMLQAVEGRVGALYVKGAKYFLPSRVRAQARSLAEGKVLNFNDVTRDIVALNQLADRRVEPKLIPTGEPGVYNVDLIVKDKLPLHGSIELNNRQSADTTELRLNGALSYNNLWQRGHTLGASYQISPQDPSEVKVFTGYYIWRFQSLDWLSLMFSGTKQDSNVSTLGAVAVAGRGNVYGLHAIATLPSREGFYQSLNAGFDYKHFDQNVTVAGVTEPTPIDYYPFSLTWDGTWLHSQEVPDPTPDEPARTRRRETGTTQVTAGVTMGFRGFGSDRGSLERNRFSADSNFFYFRGDVSHEQILKGGWQLYGKIHGQAADQPLVNSEQFGGGGQGTARGYLEAEALGDNAIFGTAEFRTPSLLRAVKRGGREGNPDDATGDEWRFYIFGDAGTVTIHDALPEQNSSARLASVGIGTELQYRSHYHGLLELALPLTSLGTTQAHDARVNFRVWADF
jgi:hemolysin activation/secretion protein